MKKEIDNIHDLVRLFLKDAGYPDDEIDLGFEFAERATADDHWITIDYLGHLTLCYIMYDQAELDACVEEKDKYQLKRIMGGWELEDWHQVCKDLNVTYTGRGLDEYIGEGDG